MYRKRLRGSQKFTERMAGMHAAREQNRLASPAPDYPATLPELRRQIVIRDFDFSPIEHTFNLYRSNRIDSYRIEVDGKPLRGRYGYARALELARKAFLRVRAI